MTSFFGNKWGSGGGGGGNTGDITVIDNLLSSNAKHALSANQGRVLDGKILAHAAKVASTTELGHVKIDGKTITFNNDGQLVSAAGEIVEASLTQKGITQLTNDISDREDIALTPKAIKNYFENAKSSLKKEEFRFENLPVGTTDIEFTPTLVDDGFIDLLFSNTTKRPSDEYSITPKDENDLTKGYILNIPAGTAKNTMVNLVLVSGVALSQGGEGNFGGLTDSQNRMVLTGNGIIPIEDPLFSPDASSLLFFRNSTKQFKDLYEIVETLTSPSGYGIQLNDGSNHDGRIYEIVVINGKNITTGGKTVQETIVKEGGFNVYTGNTPPSDTSLIWNKTES